MSTTLPHGIIQINEGNISWYGDITANWQLIDSKIGIYDAAIAAIPAPANNGRLTINYGGTTIAMFGADDAGNVTANIPAPGDGALTVIQGGSTLGTFNANQATPETIDIPAPGDGTLTIQLNGSDVQTFTANQSTAATANIQCVDLTSAQTVGGNKTFSNGLFASVNTQGDLATLTDLSINSTNEDANGMPLTGHTNSLKIKGSQYNVIPCMLTGSLSTSGNTSASLRVYKYKDTSKRADIQITYIYATGRAEAQFTNCHITTNASGVYDIGSSVRQFGTAYIKALNINGTAAGDILAHNAAEFVNVTGAQTIAGDKDFTGTTGTHDVVPATTDTYNLGSSSAQWKDVNTVLLNGKTPAYSTDIPTKVSQLTNDSGFITSENALPTGSYIQFAGSQAPAGFLVCNGGEISRTTYSALFAVIGTTYGSGDGSTTFNLPNLTDRFLQGSTTSGTVKDAGLPNILGNIGAFSRIGVNVISGAFGPAFIPAQDADMQATSSSSIGCGSVGLNASLSSSIYGNSTTVQPPALTCLICIKY